MSWRTVFLAGQAVQVDVVEDGLFGGVAEVHVKEADVALQLGVGQGAVVVGVLPGPEAGALVRLDQIVVLVVLGVDQGDVAVVGLAGGVHHGVDALGAGQGHDDAVGLHGHLADGHIEALVQSQERHDGDQGDPPHAALAVGGVGGVSLRTDMPVLALN